MVGKEIEKCLAIVEGIKTFKAYLSTGRKFTIVTDHKALKTLDTLNNSTNGRISRWHMLLVGYRYEVVYRKGENNNAELLSRYTREADQTSDHNKSKRLPSKDLDQSCSVVTPSDEKLLFEFCSVMDRNVLRNSMRHYAEVNEMELVTDINQEKEWLELSLEYDLNPKAFSLETENNSNNQDEPKEDQFHDLIELQKSCQDFKYIYDYLANDIIPEDPNVKKKLEINKEYYQLLDGILIHLFQNTAKKKTTDERFIMQVALPSKLRKSLLEQFHDNNGHFGMKKTFGAIQTKYFWPHMYQDIADYVRSCENCQRVKRDPNASNVPLNPLPVVGAIERLHMDIIGPLTKSPEGHFYILVCVCSFTRWVEAFPLQTQSASEIARILHDEIFCRYGASNTIVTDRERNFLSMLFVRYTKLLVIKLLGIVLRNGCVERQNASISQSIAKYVHKDQKNWHRVLPVVLMGMRSQPNTETSAYSPFKMLFGAKIRLPFDVNLIPRETLKPTDKIIVRELLETLKLVHDNAKLNTEITQNESKERHDSSAKESDFIILELVLKKSYKHTPGLSSKLEEKWEGPYYIVAKGTNNIYKLADYGSSFDTACNIKRYYPPETYRHNLKDQNNHNETEQELDSDNNDREENKPVNESSEKQNNNDQTDQINVNNDTTKHKKQTKTNSDIDTNSQEVENNENEENRDPNIPSAPSSDKTTNNS